MGDKRKITYSKEAMKTECIDMNQLVILWEIKICGSVTKKYLMNNFKTVCTSRQKTLRILQKFIKQGLLTETTIKTTKHYSITPSCERLLRVVTSKGDVHAKS